MVDEAWDIEPRVVEDALEANAVGALVWPARAVLDGAPACHGFGAAPSCGCVRHVGTTRRAVDRVERARGVPELDDRDAWLTWHRRIGHRHVSGCWNASSCGWNRATPRRTRTKTTRGSRSGVEYLNIWPGRKLIVPLAARRRALCDRGVWLHLTDLFATPDPDAPVTVAVEDWYGMGASAAAASVLPDGRVLVWGSRFSTRAEAYAWASYVVSDRPDARLVVGASMSNAEAGEAVPGVEVSAANTTTTRVALPLLRSLVLSGGLAHSGEDELTEQVATTRLLPSAAGGLTVAAHRCAP